MEWKDEQKHLKPVSIEWIEEQIQQTLTLRDNDPVVYRSPESAYEAKTLYTGQVIGLQRVKNQIIKRNEGEEDE